MPIQLSMSGYSLVGRIHAGLFRPHSPDPRHLDCINPRLHPCPRDRQGILRSPCRIMAAMLTIAGLEPPQVYGLGFPTGKPVRW